MDPVVPHGRVKKAIKPARENACAAKPLPRNMDLRRRSRLNPEERLEKGEKYI